MRPLKYIHLGIGFAELVVLKPLSALLMELDERWWLMFGKDENGHTPFSPWKSTVNAELDNVLTEICLDFSDIRRP